MDHQALLPLANQTFVDGSAEEALGVLVSKFGSHGPGKLAKPFPVYRHNLLVVVPLAVIRRAHSTPIGVLTC